MRSQDDSQGLAASEDRLLELAKALDEPVSREPFDLALVALGQRTRTLFRAFRQVHRGGAAEAAPALIRPMLEINFLIRFLAKAPALHTELWEAEGKRNTITIVEEFSGSEQMSKRWAAFPLGASGAADLKPAIKKARAKALEAKVISERDSAVLPSISKLLKIIDEYAAFEAYTLGYRILSWEVHGGAPAVLTERFREHADGTASYVGRRGPGNDGERALAISTFASTLRLCSHHLRLGVDDEAREIQATYVPQSPDQPVRPR
jgi:hypothetical protein